MAARSSFPVRIAAVLAAGACAALLGASAADAHSILVSSTPAGDAAFTTSLPFKLTVAGPGTAAPATAASPEGDGSTPLWPWISGGAVLLVTGFAVARRLAHPAVSQAPGQS
ncbi:hypothetical protein [Amycolatopsis sp. CA-128772]|uniref:hypothetical protein n=1 Tax=Amycolatopsis sp. CA-128772 TaxID=2073159 RepID=UPI000CD01824|nr:hypothetical protein [Amycolatopsis sp. CA-128772]